MAALCLFRMETCLYNNDLEFLNQPHRRELPKIKNYKRQLTIDPDNGDFHFMSD